MTQSSSPLLELINVNKFFNFGNNSLQVLNDINLCIYSGEMVAIIGASGSGKSTLMNIMACLDQPSSGKYCIAGNRTELMLADDLASLRREKFGFIFQRYQLLTALTAEENVTVPAVYAGISKQQRLTRARQLMTQLGLEGRFSHFPSQLSGGQQQRISIARALMNGGQIIFADEPTGALDSKSSQDVMDILTRLNREGHTIILVTHDAKVAHYASRVIEISDGRIIQDSQQQPKTSQISLTESPKNHRIKQRAYFSGIKEALRMAVLTMTINKMRTLLTMLGIIIGIASVVLIVALGNGSKQQVLKEINNVGASTLSISPGESFGDKNANLIDSLTLDDMHSLEQQSYVVGASPDLSSSMTLQMGNIERSAQVEGANLSHDTLRNVVFIEGKMFTEADFTHNRQYVVISEKVKKTFFPNQSAIGQVLLLDSVPCQIIGVFKQQGYDAAGKELKVWLPYTTLQSRFIGKSPRLEGMTLLLKQGYSSSLASEGVIRILTLRHGKKDFTIFNSDSLAKTIEKTTTTLTLLVSAIAVISLLVGGIGVMNIMLVSVTERTGEIGIRMAVGARYQDIVQQFLIEAIVVCFMGGLIGVVLALTLGGLLQLFNIQVVFSINSIVIAVFCSSLIGLVFGFMPAHRAAKMNPIDALNHS